LFFPEADSQEGERGELKKKNKEEVEQNLYLLLKLLEVTRVVLVLYKVVLNF
jgi:hypothetical protein